MSDDRPSADPGPGEPAKAVLARLQFKVPVLLDLALAPVRDLRRATAMEQLLRCERLRDTEGDLVRDYGPIVQREAALDHQGKVLREAAVALEDGPDPDRPRVTVRRARRIDPLEWLYSAGTITGRCLDAGRELRYFLEKSEPSPMFGSGLGSTGSHAGGAVIEHYVEAWDAARDAMATLPADTRASVLWVVLGGTVEGLAGYMHKRRAWIIERLQSGLDALADHFFGVEDSSSRRIRAAEFQ